MKPWCGDSYWTTTMLRHARAGDLIAIGSRGLDALDRFFLGSVSTKLIQHTPCSVLVVR